MKKIIAFVFCAAACLTGFCATKVLTLGSMAAESASDYTATASLGALATKNDITMSYVTDAGDLATLDTITLAKVTDAGDLAGMDTITLAKVTDAGSLAGKSTVTTNELAAAVVTSLGKADSAVQSVTVTTADNGGISVSVDGATAVSTALGTAATTASTAYATSAQGTKADNALPASKLTVDGTAMTPTSTAVELGSGYITVTGETNQVDIYKR